MHVDGEQLGVGVLVAARPDVDEPDDHPLFLGDERRRPAAPAGRALVDGQRRQLINGKGVGVGSLPRLHMYTGGAVRILRCSGADHRGEPTLPG
jgi:hypothetical protein